MNIRSKADTPSTAVAKQDCNPQRYRAVVDAAHDGILAINGDGLITLFNHAAAHMFGYDACDVIGQPLSILLPITTHEIHRHHIIRFANEAMLYRSMTERGEVYGRRKDGMEFPIEISLAEINVGGTTDPLTGKKRDAGRDYSPS